jgi:hypothetical protein
MRQDWVASAADSEQTEDVAEPERYRAEWEGLHLIVERRQTHWQLFVYDVAKCEVLHTGARLTCEAAKTAAMEFGLIHLHGPATDLKP